MLTVTMAVELYSPDVANQKLDYIHLNPLAEYWNLVNDPCDYEFSSAGFYEKGDTRYEFLKHLGDEFRMIRAVIFCYVVREDTNHGSGRLYNQKRVLISSFP